MQLSARQKYWIPKTMAVVGYIGYVTLSVDSHPLALAVLVGVLLLTDVVFKKIKPVEVAAGLAFGFLLVLAELEVIPYSVAGLIAAAVFIHVGGRYSLRLCGQLFYSGRTRGRLVSPKGFGPWLC